MWLTDPELFLYSKVGGDDVQVWRCKKTMMNSSTLVVPMVPDDFEYVSQVEDHSDLIDGNIIDWEETDYKALVKYISERRLLVNGQGLVIEEISKLSEEDEDDQTDADILPIIYLRSVDIPSLKAYIPKLRELPIPSRKVQYLEDVNGKAPAVEGGDSTTMWRTRWVVWSVLFSLVCFWQTVSFLIKGFFIDEKKITTTTMVVWSVLFSLVSFLQAVSTVINTKQVGELQDDLKKERSEKVALAKRVADAEAENKTLEAKNVNLDGTNTKLKQDLADTEAKNKALEAKNVNLDGTNTKLKQDLVVAEAEIKTLEAKNVNLDGTNTKLKQDLADAEAENKTLEAKNVNLEGTNTKLKQDLADAEAENKTLEAKNVNLDGTNTKLKQDLADAEAENKTLEAKNMKLKQDLATLEDKVVDLESKERTLEEKVTNLTADLVVCSKTSRDQEERITKLNAEIELLKNQVKDLESNNKTQENRITTLNADLARAIYRESWMNDITPKSRWIGFQELKNLGWVTNVTPLAGPKEYTVDDGHSTVRAPYWAQVRLNEDGRSFKAIDIDKYFVPNGRIKAKFDSSHCWTVKCSLGVSYVISYG